MKTDIAVAEQPQQLMTIEPAKYVALVFESFRKKFDAYKVQADEVTFDITTTAGMKTAVEWRAKFRDEIRIATESARKERKAPILEIGRLLDDKAKEIAKEVAPYESRFDDAIKSEEARKEAEKATKLVAEKARVDAIRAKIEEIKDCIVVAMGKTADEISSAIAELESTEITLEEYFEFSGEAQAAQAVTVSKLKEALSAQIAIEQAAAEAARHAEAERIERERVAEANRVEAKRLADLAAELERQAKEARDKQAEADRLAREQREAAEAEQRAANERAAAAMRQQQAEHEARMRAQQEELDRQQEAIDAAKAEQERIEREAQEAAEAEAARIAQAEADRIFAEQERVAEEQAAEAERREREAKAEVERAALEAEVARLHALHFANDGLGMLEDVLREIAQPVGRECCGAPEFDHGYVCCGNAEPIFHTIDSLSGELNKWRNELIQRRAEQKEAA